MNPETIPGCGRRRTAVKTVLLAFVCLATLPRPVNATDLSEPELKAAFVFNFLRFIEWPQSAFASDDNIKVCLFGKSQVTQAIEIMMQDKTANGHTISVSYIRNPSQDKGCHVLFVDASERRSKAWIPNAPALLIIGDFEGFAQQNGTINLLAQGRKVSFDINLGSAQRAGLKVNSRLLTVAHNVIE